MEKESVGSLRKVSRQFEDSLVGVFFFLCVSGHVFCWDSLFSWPIGQDFSNSLQIDWLALSIQRLFRYRCVRARACSFPCCWLRVCVGNVWFGERSEVLNRESVNIWKEVCIVEMGGTWSLTGNHRSWLACRRCLRFSLINNIRRVQCEHARHFLATVISSF